jgi:hypothetical protein
MKTWSVTFLTLSREFQAHCESLVSHSEREHPLPPRGPPAILAHSAAAIKHFKGHCKRIKQSNIDRNKSLQQFIVTGYIISPTGYSAT